jgi:hypothetical protein
MGMPSKTEITVEKPVAENFGLFNLVNVYNRTYNNVRFLLHLKSIHLHLFGHYVCITFKFFCCMHQNDAEKLRTLLRMFFFLSHKSACQDL